MSRLLDKLKQAEAQRARIVAERGRGEAGSSPKTPRTKAAPAFIVAVPAEELAAKEALERAQAETAARLAAERKAVSDAEAARLAAQRRQADEKAASEAAKRRDIERASLAEAQARLANEEVSVAKATERAEAEVWTIQPSQGEDRTLRPFHSQGTA